MHTKEPWTYEKVTCSKVDVFDESGFVICRATGDKFNQGGYRGVKKTSFFAEENARRIVACVNACAGISTEQLELDQPTFVRMLLQRQDLQLQLDELLAALKRAERKLSAYVGVCSGDKELTETVLPMARAAIAKAEE